jgi:hypothetical protein
MEEEQEVVWQLGGFLVGVGVGAVAVVESCGFVILYSSSKSDKRRYGNTAHPESHNGYS